MRPPTEDPNAVRFGAELYPRSEHDPLGFEEWLETHMYREDEVGVVARFVVADVERYCWPGYERVYRQPSSSRRGENPVLVRYVQHLIVSHGVTGRSVEIFERVYEEWRNRPIDPFLGMFTP